jgi:hypothetical protein
MGTLMRRGPNHVDLKFATYSLLSFVAEAFDGCQNLVCGFGANISHSVALASDEHKHSAIFLSPSTAWQVGVICAL